MKIATGTVGLAMVKKTNKQTTGTSLVKKIANCTCCQNQY